MLLRKIWDWIDMVFDYEKERAKLYKVLYGRELEPEYEHKEPVDFDAIHASMRAFLPKILYEPKEGKP